MIFVEQIFFSTMSCLLITLFCFYYFKKKKILLDEINYSKHKKLNFTNLDKPPLCGGIIIYISSLIFFSNGLIFLEIFGLAILIIGVFSDINKISSPKVRIFLQILSVLFFVIFSDLRITDLRIDLANELLDINYVSIIFTVFCLLILLNGSNFLDGLNTLVIGYYILVSAILILISAKFDLVLNQNIFYFFIFLIIIFLFNFFGKIYLGDSGSYLISFFAAFFLLDFIINNTFVSPYFICLLLWYPAFENLFSILRRTFFSKKIHKADQKHLHQMILKFFLKKKLINKKYINTFTANIINLFNFAVFILFYKYYLFTKFLILAILINSFVYLICYLYFKKKLNHF
jgi:UDP-N-acetylmuramyl pentapeptide phosphotransferase/UDP-N-acetylglucosamine-1-phosphate transferase